MRRLLAFAAFLLIISVVPVCAQRGGGHSASGGSHGGFSGGHASFGGGHVGGGFTGGHIGGGFGSHAGFASHGAMGAGSHFGSHMGSGRFYAHNRHFGGGRFGDRHHHGFRNRWGYGYPNYGYGYPYDGYPYYNYLPGIDPYWWWDTYPSDDADQRQIANEMNQQNLEEQQALREQDQDAYAQARPQARPAQPAVSQQAENDPKTILVFRDQHQREIQNYAIVDDVIYIFSAQRTEKVPLAVVDVPATIKANDDRGVDFRLPGVSEGQ